MAIDIWKTAQHHSSSEKCKLKPQWDITSYLSEWLSSINQQTTSVGKNVGKRKPSCTVGGNADWWSHNGKQYGGSLKTRTETMLWLSDTTSRYIPGETQNNNSKKYMHTYVHCSIIYNNQAMEATPVSINRQVDKSGGTYTIDYHLTIKKEWNLTLYDNMNGPRGHYAKWN